MRLRSAVGAGVVIVAVIAAVAVLRMHPAPTGVADTTTATAPPPVVDARARLLTDHFRHTTKLPATVRFADDPNTPPGFVFRRFIDDEVGTKLARYIAEGSLIRTSDKAVLDHVVVNVWRTDGRAISAPELAKCDSSTYFGGDSCTQLAFPNGTLAKVVRNPVFAQTAASDVVTGAPPGLRTELQAAYPSGTILTITLYSMNGAGIPLNDAAMLQLVTIPGINAPQ